jgi:hypothetical protein
MKETSGRNERRKVMDEPENSSNRILKTKGGMGNFLRRFWRMDRNQRKSQSFLEFVDSGFSSVENASLETFKLPSVPIDLDSKRVWKVLPSKSKTNSEVEKKDPKKSDEEDVHATFKYLSIMTAVYLPFLLFLWIRRNVLGTESLVRSLFFGHMLRYGIAFLLLPSSVSKSFVPESVWNFGVRSLYRLKKWWKDEKVQAYIPMWIHLGLKVVFGINSEKNTLSLGNQVNSSTGVSPPFMALGIFTLVVFLVHPDGLTWIMLGQLRDTLTSMVERSAEWIHLVRSGKVKLTTAQISTTIATVIIMFTIINSIISNWKKDTKPASTLKGKAKIRNPKKGKKGRGRNQHSISKVKTQQSHQNKPQEEDDLSESISPSPIRSRCLSDMEDTTISAGSDSNMHSIDSIAVSLPSIPQIQEEQSIQSAKGALRDEHCKSRETKSKNTRNKVEDSYEVTVKVSAQNTNKKSLTCTLDTPYEVKKKKKMNTTKKAGTSLSITKDPEFIADSVMVLQRPTNTTPSLSNVTKYNSASKNKDVTELAQRAITPKERKNNSPVLSKETSPREKKQTKNGFTTKRDSAPLICKEELKFNGIQMDSSSYEPYEPTKLYFDQNEDFDLNNVTSSSTSDIEMIQDTSGLLRQQRLEQSSCGRSGYFHSSAQIELSSFLSKLGLHETVLSRLSNVESLNQLTDNDYDGLGIDSVKRTVIRSALEVRSMYQQSQSNPNLVGLTTTKVRAPPGICAPVRTSNHMKEGRNAMESSSLFSSSVIPATSHYSFSIGSSTDSLSGMYGYTENSVHSNKNPQFSKSVSDQVVLPPLSPLCHDSPPCTFDSEAYKPKNQGEEDVEAEMEVLGGQMAVSILDF